MVLERIQVRIRGTLLTVEEWSVNPNFIGNFSNSVPTSDALQDWCEDILGEIGSGAYGGLTNALSSACTIDAVDAYYYNASGVLAVQGSAVAAAPIRGGGSFKLPPASSLVLSLGTGAPGRRARGRVYWPALGMTLSTAQAGISPTDAQAMADQFSSLLGAMEDSFPAPGAVVAAVYSQANGQGRRVEQIRVGSQIDSQRRRREGLRETYVVSNRPAP